MSFDGRRLRCAPADCRTRLLDESGCIASRRVHAVLGVMTWLVVCCALLLVLAGCAADATVRVSAADLPGTYYSGDGMGRNVTVVLNGDGTFTSDWQGCLGAYGQARGTWLLEGDQVLFSPANEQEMLTGYLRQATTIRHAGQLGFARAEDVVDERVDEPLVFLKQSSTD